MARCNMCGNDYEGTFDVTFKGRMYTFDCFECAIHQLAPTCEACGIRIVGHGVQAQDRMFCCAHCARQMGVQCVQTHV
jgi:hypothetical protein